MNQQENRHLAILLLTFGQLWNRISGLWDKNGKTGMSRINEYLFKYDKTRVNTVSNPVCDTNPSGKVDLCPPPNSCVDILPARIPEWDILWKWDHCEHVVSSEQVMVD